jgi:hypothetical protein
VKHLQQLSVLVTGSPRDPETVSQPLVFCRLLVLDSIKSVVRNYPTIPDIISDLGGLSKVLVLFLTILYSYYIDTRMKQVIAEQSLLNFDPYGNQGDKK